MIDTSALPVHVGIIMDGNGRWAKKRNLPRSSGHKEGLTAAKNIVRKASELGIQYVTLYTFSTENWKRAQDEVGYLMGLIKVHLRGEFDFYKQNGIRIQHIGDLDGLPKDVQLEIVNATKETAHFTGTTVVLAINYGGRNEIVRGVKKMLQDAVDANDITEEKLQHSFDIPNLPDVDLLIRTGGEMRISNFLLWHAAYAEFLFTDTLWPDYNCEEFLEDIEKFQKRTRRFGGVV
ncbi:MAG: di-trans,poly-cis-decaprenylcistransferase [Treponema sp.]|nr:di-trans,poly-cis-decaprenylcistransferase [Treponema sp.]MBD5412156.1 di-trans,poly-cis-decaprenylcistransferase [Treponema sp.]MDE6245819.1 di-trans,poly-cis-decaprenylcistransferase [Treponemataceae bacterium]